MTLTELYYKLNWQQADQAEQAFLKVQRANKNSTEYPLPEDQKRISRCNIIHGALYEENQERQAFCIRALEVVGVWKEIKKILKQENLWPREIGGKNGQSNDKKNSAEDLPTPSPNS